jgi:kinetochore protein Mis13/DSN1
VNRLQNERHALNALLRPPSIPHYTSLQTKQPTATTSGSVSRKQQTSSSLSISLESRQLDTSVLDQSQTTLLLSLGLDGTSPPQRQETWAGSAPVPALSPTQIYTRLSRISKTLAPTLDSFASGIHDIELYRSTADTVSSQILRICSQRLEERDAQNALVSSQIEEEAEEGEGETDGTNNNKNTSNTRSRTKDLKTTNRIRLHKEKQKEDIGLVLGALSRVERR